MNALDQLLHDWSARTEPTDEALQVLQQRIGSAMASATDGNVVGSAGVSLSRTEGTVRSTGSWVIVATAAALLLAVGVLRPRTREQYVSSLAPELSGESVAARQLLFNELDRMFDGHWRWFGEVNGRVHLQTDEPAASDATVADADAAVADDGVAVRLAVIQRRPGETDWRVVWDASVIARSDEWVHLPESLIGDDMVSVWVHSLPDGLVLIESNVTLTAPVAVHSSEQQVFGPSVRPARLWSTRRADGEFQLIQTFARLEAHHG